MRHPLSEPSGLSIDPVAIEVTEMRGSTRRLRRRADAAALVRVINKLTMENVRLRRQLTAPNPVIHVLRDHPRAGLRGPRAGRRARPWRAVPRAASAQTAASH
ncbi:hypothetical protein GCM10010211_47440 [Streptomyces albospinus]|uniref:Transposase n=1 Tax=Streptomyces albospinus TaxID=285515 RepID=A0ABQ2VA86_9ACTN|nr:hypothetical protein GCM10010211_47440 [Streptomyces albospinus]